MDKKVSAYAKGLMGEGKATEYLQARGMVLLERRYRSPFGEIDLVMRDMDTLVFVEVKTRGGGEKGDGLAAITPTKQKRLLETALYYVQKHRADCMMRFDAVEITPQGVVYIANAFEVPPQ